MVKKPCAEDGPPFNVLTVTGIVMLGVFCVPCILRPIDFLKNFGSYTLGMISYILLLPVFTNVFQIYAMSNLHDVSWGNRPATTGQEAFTDNKKDAKKNEEDYKVFRTNFMFFWVACQGAYFIGLYALIQTDKIAKTKSDTKNKSGNIGYLEAWSIWLASLVMFRVVFAFGFVILWRYRQWFQCSGYKMEDLNLNKELKRIKKEHINGDSTDEEEIEHKIDDFRKSNNLIVSQYAQEKGLTIDEADS